MLSNLYLDAFDRAMLAAGYRAVRYSDDIAIPVADRGAAEQALAVSTAEALSELRLSRRDIAETLAVTRLVLPGAGSIGEIMGHEGMASREYFRAWRDLLGGDWEFTERQRRPPPDPVNATLSFGYTLLTLEAVAALGTAGLDPAVGFLHQARWGRPSLALDIMEEFRPLIVDAVVLRCAATGIVRPEEFETIPEQGCRMNPHARHAFLAAYERRMLTLFTHEPSGRRVSYRTGLGLQARALARTLLNPDHPYRPVRWK